MAGADVITVDIGSNDVLVTAREVAANAIGCTEKELDVTVIRMLTDLQNSSGFQAMIKGAKVYALAYKVKHELNSGAKMKSIESTFEQNFKSIMSEIKALNPNAKVYIGNLYNPYIEAAPMCIGDIELVNLEVMSETYVNKLNTIIKNNSNESIVVDLYSVIRNPKYIKGDVRNHDYDPHPNSEGQKLIADKFIAKMK